MLHITFQKAQFELGSGNPILLEIRIRAQIKLSEKLYEAFKTGFRFEAIFCACSVNFVQNQKGEAMVSADRPHGTAPRMLTPRNNAKTTIKH